MPSSILWVDDEVESGDPSVGLLTTDGYRVDCAQTAAAALAQADARSYDLILLDLRLPDATGLAVLETIRSRGIHTPVLVLTGFGDVPTSVAAMRLGAADVRQKPLVGDELLDAVRSVQSSGCAERTSSPAFADVQRACKPLLAAVDRWTRDDSPSPSQSRRLLMALVDALREPDLDLEAFLVCAAAVRDCAARLADSAEGIAADLRALATSPTRWRVSQEHRETLALMTRADSCVAGRTQPRNNVLDAAVPGFDVERFLRSRTQMGLGQWRSVLAMRHAVALLCGDDAALKQVAWKVGFEHASQFDREFARLFGLAPGEFRRLARAAE
jgi:DNA-binding response OmpR family regulator